MTRQRVLDLPALGRSQAEIARELGLAESTVAYHARRALPPDPKFPRRYDWAAIQAYYDAGHSITECQERFGFAPKTWHDARARGAVVSRPHGLAVEAFFVAGRARNRRHVYQRLLGRPNPGWWRQVVIVRGWFCGRRRRCLRARVRW